MVRSNLDAWKHHMWTCILVVYIHMCGMPKSSKPFLHHCIWVTSNTSCFKVQTMEPFIWIGKKCSDNATTVTLAVSASKTRKYDTVNWRVQKELTILFSPCEKKAKKLHDVAWQHDISLTENKAVIEEGWVGKSKGILQILWEHRLIDNSNYKMMTLDGRKDPDSGGIFLGTSLHALLNQCSDFTNELRMLQLLGQEIGITADAMPKYHAELAGEGITYSWGYSKGVYCQVPLSRKKGKKNFFELVEECCNLAIHLTKERVRKWQKHDHIFALTITWCNKWMNKTIIHWP